MAMAAKTAGFSAAMPRPWAAPPGDAPWRPAADRLHGAAAITALSGAALLCLASPGVGDAFLAYGGAALLVGGALIGMPHGSSDFVVAYRLMRPALGWRWLPCFLVLYLALVAATLAAWALVPLVTLLAFLAISGLHFGWGDMRATGGAVRPGLAFAVRATTPVLPIFLIHPSGVAGFIAALGGVTEEGVLQVLLALRWPLLVPWGLVLLAVTLPPLLRVPTSISAAVPVRAPAPGRSENAALTEVESLARSASRDAVRGAAELAAIALAAVTLPPLLAFGLYFCLVHAVRHMLDLAEQVFPRRPAAAARLVAAVVLPSALACLALLALTWDALGGASDTAALVTWSLRVIAALTVPHMVLEGVAALPYRRRFRTAYPRHRRP